MKFAIISYKLRGKWLESSIEKQNKKYEKSDFTVNKIIDTTNLI